MIILMPTYTCMLIEFEQVSYCLFITQCQTMIVEYIAKVSSMFVCNNKVE
jgi:hypothetical protein